MDKVICNFNTKKKFSNVNFAIIAFHLQMVLTLKSHYSREHESNEPPFEVSSNDETQVDPLKIEADIKPEPCEYYPLAMSVPIISKIEPEE